MENIDKFYNVIILKAFVLKFHHKQSLKLFMEWGKLNLFKPTKHQYPKHI